ncbi:hypothetical protein [Cerasicoccus arenae]|uniref:Uncharacterized protein n=1 Tax=Cerasicoccus arenae TaxID=424488 RepID=A0A8J3GDY6_9BACT|nr:hypothetical protein [Cerasicoccus arenae]MBK1856754.1 hypothetical protein [Cerasicoccus arenae]GHB99286.1 hypothetical protein GCM10007047_14370 [Cerasicoccus arenae]
MELQSTTGRGFQGTLHVTITAEQFPAITRHCLGDPEFQQLIADNLERVVEEYLNAAEIQVAATKD